MLLSSIITLLCVTGEAAATRMIGFYQSSFQYKGFSVSDIDASKYTVLKYSFINVDKNTNSCVIGDPYGDAEKLFPSDDPNCKCCARGALNQMFHLKVKNPHLRTIMTIGGWMWSKNFSSVASAADSRKQLASSCVKMMIDYGFDGIDVDWEFPGSPTRNVGVTGNGFSNDDGANFVELLKEFRKEMSTYTSKSKKPYMLTIDIAPLQWYFSDQQLQTLSSGVLDWFNVMHYEFALDGNRRTRHSSNLNNCPADPLFANNDQYYSVKSSINSFLKSGVPANMLVVGVPAYGRGYTGVSAGNSNGLFQQFSGTSGTLIPYSTILANIDKGVYKRYFDSVGNAAYVFDGNNFVTYEDVAAVTAKADYVNQNGLAGIMIWDVAQDVSGSDSLSNAAMSTLKGIDKTPRTDIDEPASKFCNIQNIKLQSDASISRSALFFTLMMAPILLMILF